jgi:hypothetical protein
MISPDLALSEIDLRSRTRMLAKLLAGGIERDFRLYNCTADNDQEVAVQ